jgi:hypothetical protein
LSEHLTARQIEEFNQRASSPSELLATMNHIALCEACRSQLSSEQKTRAAVESLQTDLRRQGLTDHLTYEELAASVDDSLSSADREVAESHVDACSRCAAELADLRAFKAEMTTHPEIERRPAAAPTFLEKIIAFLRVPSIRIPVQLASAAIVLLLCVSVAILLLRKEPAIREISELQQKDEAPTEQRAKPQPPSLIPVPPAAEIAETINDGGSVVTIDKEGNVSGLESLSPGYQRDVKAALKGRRVEAPSQLQELIGKAGVLMGSSGEANGFSLIGPVGAIIRTDRPSFHWKPLKGAAGYVVAVYDSGFNKVASSEAQSRTDWSPSSSLKRGETYSWQVTAIKDGNEVVSPAPPAPAAKFKVLDSASNRELEHIKRVHPDSHLVLGVLYQRAGLLDDAQQEFNIVHRANPTSELVKKLLRDVKSLRK